MIVSAWIAAMIAAAVIAVEVVRRLPPRVGAALFVGVPLLATPLWLKFNSAPLFSFVKVYSACAGVVYIEVLKATRWAERPWGRRAAYLLLVLNIVEAAVADLLEASRIHAVAAILLVLTQAYPSAITVDRGSPRRDVLYDLGGWWVAAYSLWNFAFVYGHRPAFAAFASVHLVAPLVACRGRPELYVQARASALAVLMIVRMSAPEPPFIYTVPHWYSPAVGAALHAASIAMTLLVAARALRDVRQTRVARSLLEAMARPLVRRGEAA